eukprot:COSAG05_NODE_50_length_24118_cov_89.534036_9_plen_470_part_00
MQPKGNTITSVRQELFAAQERIHQLEERVKELESELAENKTRHPSAGTGSDLGRQQSSARHLAVEQSLQSELRRRAEHLAAQGEEIKALKRSISAEPGHWVCAVGGGNVPFDAHINDILQQAFSECMVANFERDSWPYTVDFTPAAAKPITEAQQMYFQQRNTHTGATRTIHWEATAFVPPRWPEYFGASSSSRPDLQHSLESITEPQLLAALNSCIQPANPTHLGKGGDISATTKSYWEGIPETMRALSLERAWRVHHSSSWMRYVAAREGVANALQRVPVHLRYFLGCEGGALQQSFAEATARLPGKLDTMANEAYLLTGLPSDIVLNVLEQGLNANYNTASNFGCGCYFAEDAAKNDQYTGDAGAEPDELREVLYGAIIDNGPEPEPEPARSDDTGGLNYLLLCRVALGCSVRTNGKGRLPMCLDKGVCAINREGMEDAVFWSYQDPGPITWENFREHDDSLECAQ